MLVSFALQIIVYSIFPFYLAQLEKMTRKIAFYTYISITLLVGGFIGSILSVPITDTINISAGNIAYGALMMTSILFVIIERDIFIIKGIVRLVIIVNLFKILLFSVVAWSLSQAEIINPYNTSASVFNISIWFIILGGVLIIGELIFLLYLFEKLKKSIKNTLLLAIVYIFSFIFILCLDGLLFPLIAFGYSDNFINFAIGGVAGKLIMASAYSIPLAIFLYVYRNELAQYAYDPPFAWQNLFMSSSNLMKHMQANEKKIALTNQLLNESQKIALLGAWKLDIKTGDLFWTDETYQIFDISQKEYNPTIDTIVDYFLPDSKEILSKALDDAINKGIGYDLELEINTTKGRKIDLRTTCLVTLEEGVPIELMGIIQDISIQKANQRKQKNIENELLISNNKFEKAFNQTPNIIMISNFESNEVYDVNKTCETILGYKKEEYLAKTTPNINLWVNDDDRIEYLNTIKKNGFVENATYSFYKKNGDKAILNIYANVVIIDNKEYILAVCADVTELKQKNEMLINQSRHAAMGEMIGMIAHQWRQPLSSISMVANNMLMDIALDDFNNSTAQIYANSITEQTQHLSKTIDDFRNFFRPDKDLCEVNIKDVLDDTVSIVKDSFKNNNIELTISIDTDQMVEAYPRELMQVFVNIINNAKDVIKYNKPENASINISVYEEGKYINTVICDNGGGIDSDILPKIFDPYFTTKDEKTGTGLGLYMSKMIIEEHLNGVIDAYNIDNGACFTIKLLKIQKEKE